MSMPLLLTLLLAWQLPATPDAPPARTALHVGLTATHVLIDSRPILGLAGTWHLVPRPVTRRWVADGPVFETASSIMEGARAAGARIPGRVALFVDALTPARALNPVLYRLGQAEFDRFDVVVQTPAGRGHLPFVTIRWACPPHRGHPSDRAKVDWTPDDDGDRFGAVLAFSAFAGHPRPCHALALRWIAGGWQFVSTERWVRDTCGPLTNPAGWPIWPALDDIPVPAGEVCLKAEFEAQPDATWGALAEGLRWLDARGARSIRLAWWLDDVGLPPSVERPKR